MAPVRIDFGFAGLVEKHAKTIMRDILRGGWPEAQRHDQCVYIVRLVGRVAVAYPRAYSPVIYIGEGSAFDRLYNHTHWLVPLVSSVPQLGIDVRVARVRRRNQPTLYQFVEADLIGWFNADTGSLPWFNKQREASKEGQYQYSPKAKQSLHGAISLRSGTHFEFAIRPTHNSELFEPYARGSSLPW